MLCTCIHRPVLFCQLSSSMLLSSRHLFRLQCEESSITNPAQTHSSGGILPSMELGDWHCHLLASDLLIYYLSPLRLYDKEIGHEGTEESTDRFWNPRCHYRNHLSTRCDRYCTADNASPCQWKSYHSKRTCRRL